LIDFFHYLYVQWYKTIYLNQFVSRNELGAFVMILLKINKQFVAVVVPTEVIPVGDPMWWIGKTGERLGCNIKSSCPCPIVSYKLRVSERVHQRRHFKPRTTPSDEIWPDRSEKERNENNMLGNQRYCSTIFFHNSRTKSLFQIKLCKQSHYHKYNYWHTSISLTLNSTSSMWVTIASKCNCSLLIAIFHLTLLFKGQIGCFKGSYLINETSNRLSNKLSCKWFNIRSALSCWAETRKRLLDHSY